MLKEMGITRRDMIRYAFLPGILPRLRGLTRFSLGNLAYIMAMVFNTARILPNNHRYLSVNNMGTFGVRQVIAEAANHLRPEWKYADQFIIFFAILVAMVIMVLQFFLIVLAALTGTSQASDVPMPTTHAGFFKTPDPENDIAFRLLDLVFGVPDFFQSKEIKNIGPMQKALQSLFEFYSYGLLIVGFFIILYFVITIVAETAQSGTPFGRRFNVAWAPVRLVVFFALLIPVTSGLNGGQLVALAAAKYGSGLATNGWLLFNNVIAGKYLGEKEALVGMPETPEIAYLLDFMLIAKTCVYSEARHSKHGEVQYPPVEAYIMVGDTTLPLSTSYQDATKATKGGNIYIRFGQKHESFKALPANVWPSCGEIIINTSDTGEPGSAKMQEQYLEMVRKMWGGEYQLDTHGENFNLVYSEGSPRNREAPLPGSEYRRTSGEKLKEQVTKFIEIAVETQIKEGKWDPDENMKKVGWAGAGIWYNKVAQQNGALMTAVRNTPQISLMPGVMEYVRLERTKQDKFVPPNDQYTPTMSNGERVKFNYDSEADIAMVLNQVFQYTVREGSGTGATSNLTGNIIIDTVNLLFGTKGLYDLCKDTKIHPLAQLSLMGKTLIESSVRTMGLSVLGGVAGGVAALMQNQQLSSAGFAISGFFMTITTTGLLVGFILFYVVPFMPFMYFFFGVGSWVKGLFEAMVGIPLWALAHLRIDGEGLPGQAASQGYFLILEIFLRPILMVIGMLAAIAIFAAMVKVLNEIFYLVIANATGHNPTSTGACFNPPQTGTGATPAPSQNTGTIDVKSLFRGPIDEFFFTVIYAMIVYMIGVSAFKLIDKIPDHVIRWLEDGVSSFGAKDVDPAEGLVKRVAVGGATLGGKLKGGMEGMVAGLLK